MKILTRDDTRHGEHYVLASEARQAIYDSNAAMRAEKAVMARWINEALDTLSTLSTDEQEDGGKALRKLINSGQKLVLSALLPRAASDCDEAMNTRFGLTGGRRNNRPHGHN